MRIRGIIVHVQFLKVVCKCFNTNFCLARLTYFDVKVTVDLFEFGSFNYSFVCDITFKYMGFGQGLFHIVY